MCREDNFDLIETEEDQSVNVISLTEKERKLMERYIKLHIDNIPKGKEQQSNYLWAMGGKRWIMLTKAILIAIANFIVIMGFLIVVAVLLNIIQDEPRLIPQSIVIFVSFIAILKGVNMASLSYLNKMNLEHDVVVALVQYYDQIHALKDLAEKLEEAKRYTLIVARLKSAQRITATKF